MKRRVMGKTIVLEPVSVTIGESYKNNIIIDTPDLNNVPAGVPIKILWNAFSSVTTRACGSDYHFELCASDGEGYFVVIDTCGQFSESTITVWFKFTKDCNLRINRECDW